MTIQPSAQEIAATSAPFRILTNREKARIVTSILCHALAHKSVSKLSNRAVAVMLGVSEYAVKTQKRAMIQIGALGVIEGNAIPNLPKAPLTTWERFHDARYNVANVLQDARCGEISSPYIPSLAAVHRVATSIANESSPDLHTVANAADMMETMLDLCA